MSSEGSQSMRGKRAGRRYAGLAALVAIVMTSSAGDAIAGEYAVANCQADPLNFSTRAFDNFATRGMKIRRACNPEGPGLRGLITGNVIRGGQVQRGAVALLTINAPQGTRFTRFLWGGTVRREDCRYALQMWADAPDIDTIPIKNVRANQHCPRPARAQAAGYRVRTFDVTGATQIVQRAICIGGDGKNTCSSRGSNYVRTYKAEVGIVDPVAPTATILGDTPLARGEWVGGTQPLNYDASDNVGVRSADAIASGRTGGSEQRPCAFAVPEGAFAERVPCPNGPGRIGVDTSRLLEGIQPLVINAHDSGGNDGYSPAVTARIDNTPPANIDVSLEGGDNWRSRNDFVAAWINPPEADRAPIAAVSYKLCRAASASCTRGDQLGNGISRLGMQVPAPGEWTLSLWRRDAAGNETEAAASVPVTLRFDPDPPELAFEATSASDPTLVSVPVTDAVSGLAGGTIEMSPAGSGIWQSLPTEKDGGRLVARIDDSALPAGAYQLRARATDQAGNEASTDRRLDGQPMSLTLPLRIDSRLRAGFQRMRAVRQPVRRHGKRHVVRRRVTVLEPFARVDSGGHARIAGRLVNRDGQGIAGAEVRVLSSSDTSPEQLVAALQTDADGRFRYRAAGSTSRTLRFAYAGSLLILPAERAIKMSVPARTSLSVNRSRVLNGQAVTFSGRLRTQPAPPGGKLVELQARLANRWQTFRTTRTDADGRWAIPYRFKRTRGVQRFRFRARVPAEASYPFARGGSRVVKVRVRGL